MSNSAERKPAYSDPLLILISALLLVALLATVYFAGSRPAHEFTKEPAVRPRPIITNDTRVVLVTQSVAPAGTHGVPAAGAAPAALPAETQPAVAAKPTPAAATGAAVTAAAPVVKATQDGKVKGKAVLIGTPPPEKAIGALKSDANCGKANTAAQVTTRNYVVDAGGGLANAVVYVKQGLAGSFPAPASKPLIDQAGCMYEPYIMAVMVGQKFDVRNSDPFLHNVNAAAKVNKGFNFAQANAGQVNEKVFDKPEQVRFACNVHPWMIAYVHVLENPFFVVTNNRGEFELPAGLPAGKYTVEVSHQKAGTQTFELDLAAGAGADVVVEFAVK
jgi:plastocyanin